MPYSSYAWNALGIAQARQGQLPEALESLGQGGKRRTWSVSTLTNWLWMCVEFSGAGICMPLRGILPEKSYLPTEHLEVHLTL